MGRIVLGIRLRDIECEEVGMEPLTDTMEECIYRYLKVIAILIFEYNRSVISI